MPSPLTAVAIGRRNGSASRAVKRSTTCIASTTSPRPPASFSRLGSMRPSAPSCTSTMALPATPTASTRRPSSRFRSRWDGLVSRAGGSATTSLRPSVVVALRSTTTRTPRLDHVLLQGRDDLLGVLQAVPADRRAHLRLRVVLQLVRSDVRELDDVGQPQRADGGLYPLIDGDAVVVEPDVVLRLGITVRADERDDEPGEEHRDRREPDEPATPEPAAVLADEGLEVVLRLGLEARLRRRRGRPDRMEQEGRQAGRPALPAVRPRLRGGGPP